MSSNSEARKRQEDLARVADSERRREVVQQALEHIYGGAGFVEADCFLDALEDRGGSVVVR